MKKIGIIGCGSMGEAILKGIISNKVALYKNISVSDTDSAKLNRIKGFYNVDATFNNSMVAEGSDIIILAVKPQDIDSVLTDISESLDKKKLVISIAAGITIKRITSILGKGVAVVRVMPNMPALIKKGFSAVSCSRHVTSQMAKQVKKILSSIGDVVEVKEKDLDAITAISGSGPAYFFYLAELLIASGIKLGLSKEIAKTAALDTALGSAELLNRLGEDAGALRKKVTSKGGTTEAAFKVFKSKKLDKIITSGIMAARKRAKELSGG